MTWYVTSYKLSNNDVLVFEHCSYLCSSYRHSKSSKWLWRKIISTIYTGPQVLLSDSLHKYINLQTKGYKRLTCWIRTLSAKERERNQWSRHRMITVPTIHTGQWIVLFTITQGNLWSLSKVWLKLLKLCIYLVLEIQRF